MSEFEFNNIEDFVFSKSFRQWLLQKDEQDALFWQKWVSNNPEKSELLNNAKAIIYALQGNLKNLSDEDILLEIKKILRRLKSEEYADNQSYSGVGRKKHYLKSLVIASLFIMGLGYFFIYDSGYYNRGNTKTYPDIYAAFIAQKDMSGITKNFKEDTSQNIQLPDGSVIFLKPNSKLTYAYNFSDNKREVYLTGEAFFKIKKDPARPFIVYTSSIVAKVLGTSFWIKAYSTDKQAVVTVRTGKVSVYKSKTFNNLSKEQFVSGLVATPNQELVYNKENNELNKTLTEKPELLISKPVKNLFAFKATPVAKVFKTLENAYGINIVFDEEIMSDCSLSAVMGDETFYSKLDMICKAINATYEIIDGNIIIASKGCK